MSLWLCLRFDRLALQSLSRQNCDLQVPVVVLEKQRVIQACDLAGEKGIKPGMGTATARALTGDIRMLERDLQAEQQCLQELSCWAYSISPSLYRWREDCLLVEIGSCLTLFGGLDNILGRIHSDLSLRGYSYQRGLAPTAKAAWLLSYADQDDHLSPLKQQLGPLELRLMDDFPQQVDSLAKAGLWYFADILDLSQQALARRCGKTFIEFLQQVLGTRYDEQPDFQPPRVFSDHYWFGYEVKANQELLPAAQLLLQSLCEFLRNAQLQSQKIEWRFYGIQKNTTRLNIHCSIPQASWQEWYRLTALKVEQLKLESGIEGMALCCDQLCDGNYHNQDLFNHSDQSEPLHSLLDKLRNRLGLQAVKKIASRDEHLPEYACYSSCQMDILSKLTKNSEGDRPFWLMPSPEALGGRRDQLQWNGKLRLINGPERIEDNWWAEPVSRDYYMARNDSGQLYWVYRDRLLQQWFIQGVFA